MRNVLIVEDNLINRKMLTGILRRSYNVLQCVNGLEAMKILQDQSQYISAVMLDINMPLMDGYEVLAAMRSEEKLKNIPVLVATSDMDEDAEEKALSLGANDFFLKPYKPSIIMHRLKNTISLRENAAIINAVEKDKLTGLLSEAFFLKRAQDMIDGGSDKLLLLCCQTDHVELFNELYGAQSEASIIQKLGQTLNEHLSKGWIIGRIGHDQFAAIGPEQDFNLDDLEAIEGEVNRNNLALNLHISHGIYYVDSPCDIPARVLCNRALGAAISIINDRTQISKVYDQSFTKALLDEQFIVNNMAVALEEGQFKVYYQPKNDLKTGRLIGAEALVRWINPQKGFISPGEFIPVLENNGLITKLDQWVWENACKDIKKWKEDGIAVPPVSVNVSRIDILNPEITKILNDLMDKYELQHSDLHLEITESAYTHDSSTLVDVVLTLRKQGFILEMDDFGKGFSSLSMLASLPINILKLDMAFIRVENPDGRKSAILTFVVRLAQDLKIPVIAEGVETIEQVESLKDIGCEFAQGYYFSKPLAHDDFETYMKESK